MTVAARVCAAGWFSLSLVLVSVGCSRTARETETSEASAAEAEASVSSRRVADRDASGHEPDDAHQVADVHHSREAETHHAAHGRAHAESDQDHHQQARAAHRPKAGLRDHSTDREAHVATDRGETHNKSDADHAEHHGTKTAESQVAGAAAAESDEDAASLFRKRILPILKSPNVSSCTECHLSGVDLKQYIHADQAKTFASLRADGLIDVDDPDSSKILTFIARKPEKPNPLIERVRQAELAAFRAWVRAAVADPELLNEPVGEQHVGIELSAEVIRHARKDRVLSSFVDNVWSQFGRCQSCHSPERNQRQVRKFGEQMSWIVPGDPAATLEELVEDGNIDVDQPKESPLLKKPAGLMDHGGGPKFLVGGPTYRQFVAFLTDYAAVVSGQYQKPEDLPEPPEETAHLTRQHLRIVGLPKRFDKMPLKVDLYRWNDDEQQWSKDRWATAFNPVNGQRGLWQSMISVTAAHDSARAEQIRSQHTPRLPRGRYLAKLYVDEKQTTRDNPNYDLGDEEFIGQVEITGPWPPGYQPPKIVQAPSLIDR